MAHDPSDMVTVFGSQNHDAEQECMAIHSLLEANGIESVVIGATVLPVLEFRVEVPRESQEEAERVIREAQEAGPDAAAEAEAASEDAV
jgi:hypothetical protein